MCGNRCRGSGFRTLLTTKIIRAVSGADVAVMLYMGIFQVGLAYVLVTRALRQVPAFEANTVLLLEPALNPVWVWMLHGERPGAWALVGGAVILAATLWNASPLSRGAREVSP